MTHLVARFISRQLRRFAAVVSRAARRMISRFAAFVGRAATRTVSYLRRRGLRNILRAMAPVSVGIALLGLAFWQATRVLPVKGAPTMRPPAVAVELPARGLHSTSNGYVISLAMTVRHCSEPVSIYASIVLPKEYFDAEDTGGMAQLAKALVGIAVDDPQVKMISMEQSGWQRDRQLLHYPRWRVGFNKSLLVGGTGQAEVLRLDDWRSRPSGVEAWFSANWLVQRGYGSCWLRLPELSGGDVPNVAINSSDVVDSIIGPKSGATDTQNSSGGSGTYHYYRPNGTIQTYHESEPSHTDYVSGLTPPVVGYVTLVSPMSIIPGESSVPAPDAGAPRWSCSARPHQSITDLMKQGQDSDGELRYFDPPTVGEFSDKSYFDCSGVIALSEPGSQSGHDLLLLIIGGLISLGGGLILESIFRQLRREKDTLSNTDAMDGAGNSASSTAPRADPNKTA